MDTSGKNQKSSPVLTRIYLITLVIAIALTILTAIAGCKLSSRDSGSTVTGRSLSFPGGFPMPYVRVQLYGGGANRLLVTNSSGSYTMPKVPTGSYALTFARFGIELFSTTVAVAENDQTYVVDLPDLQPGITDIPGRVSDFMGPISGADIWILYKSGGIAHTMSDQDGNFSLPDLPDGDVSVLIMADDHVSELMEDERVGFEGIFRLDVVLNPTTPFDGGTVGGVVHNADGVGIADAYVGLFANDLMPSIYMVATSETLTSPDGSFEMTDLPPGTYQAIVIVSGYELSSTLVIVEGQNTYNLDIQLIEVNY